MAPALYRFCHLLSICGLGTPPTHSVSEGSWSLQEQKAHAAESWSISVGSVSFPVYSIPISSPTSACLAPSSWFFVLIFNFSSSSRVPVLFICLYPDISSGPVKGPSGNRRHTGAIYTGIGKVYRECKRSRNTWGWVRGAKNRVVVGVSGEGPPMGG